MVGSGRDVNLERWHVAVRSLHELEEVVDGGRGVYISAVHAFVLVGPRYSDGGEVVGSRKGRVLRKVVANEYLDGLCGASFSVCVYGSHAVGVESVFRCVVYKGLLRARCHIGELLYHYIVALYFERDVARKVGSADVLGWCGEAERCAMCSLFARNHGVVCHGIRCC